MSRNENADSDVLELLDHEPSSENYLGEIVKGLSSSPKRLPSKLFYDERGSELFEQICDLDEYYLTRTELSIMEQFAPAMAKRIGEGVALIELGSGASVKTRILLNHLVNVTAYIPVDISREHLRRAAETIHNDYQDLHVSPVCADFTRQFTLPFDVDDSARRVVYFPGSTIGNFEPAAAVRLLKNTRSICQSGGGLLIGIDRQKDIATLESAYNDGEGITAQFNENILERLNDEFDADFDLSEFAHRAFYNVQHGRIEMHLKSTTEQSARIDGQNFEFDAGESICTEYSYKFSIDGFARLAADAGFQLEEVWSDQKEMFSVLYLGAK